MGVNLPELHQGNPNPGDEMHLGEDVLNASDSEPEEVGKEARWYHVSIYGMRRNRWFDELSRAVKWGTAIERQMDVDLTITIHDKRKRRDVYEGHAYEAPDWLAEYSPADRAKLETFEEELRRLMREKMERMMAETEHIAMRFCIPGDHRPSDEALGRRRAEFEAVAPRRERDATDVYTAMFDIPLVTSGGHVFTYHYVVFPDRHHSTVPKEWLELDWKRSEIKVSCPHVRLDEGVYYKKDGTLEWPYMG
jgi:hypothetical protein